VRTHVRAVTCLLLGLSAGLLEAQATAPAGSRGERPASAERSPRERISINDNWRFTRDDPPGNTVELRYDVRPEITYDMDGRPADAEPRPPEEIAAVAETVLKPWILPTGNPFIRDPARRHARPRGNPGGDVAYVQGSFDDSTWQRVDLPHDWAIEGPWLTSGPYGGMGRLPSWGIGWYRKKLDIPASDAGRSIFVVRTTSAPAVLEARPDRAMIRADGLDLAFVTVRVLDAEGQFAPRAKNRLRFTVDGPGEIVATDNGDPTSFVPFQSPEREAFNGLALVIVRAKPGETGRISLTASGEGLSDAVTTITSAAGSR
jgi:hypothetical protein